MIFRYKDIASPPQELSNPKWDVLKQEALVKQASHEANTTCYRDTTIDELMKLYHNKCAICERDRGTELQVDHYRPKKPRDNKTNTEYNQPGYYWLAYEWSNLIPLCSKCNQKKSNKFPLAGWNHKNRIINHIDTLGILGFAPYSIAWLQYYEKPLLINPECDLTPERHFSIKRDGKMIGRTEEGIETIIICDLNRKDLRRERLKIRAKYVNGIKTAFDDFAINNDISELKGELKGVFKRIKRNCHIDEPHSFYHVYLYQYFDYFIDSKLPMNLKGQATKYFNDFKISFP
jgi:hypothetical protein